MSWMSERYLHNRVGEGCVLDTNSTADNRDARSSMEQFGENLTNSK